MPIIDKYVQRAYIYTIMSAANTITFTQVRFPVGVFSNIALRITRVDWYPSTAALREIVGAADSLQMALTSKDDLTVLDPANQSIICNLNVVGIAANVEKMITPFTSDFSTLPEQGLLIPANPLFVGITSGGFAAVAIVRVVIYYRFVQLKPQESVELLQALLPGNV